MDGTEWKAPTMHTSSPHLVMAVAWGYELDIYRAFVLTLRETAKYRGDIKLLGPARNRTRPEALALCSRHRVQVVDFSHLGLGYAPGALPRFMMGERFNMYHALCSGGSYHWCLASDFRDVFFQANPFRGLESSMGGGGAAAAAAAASDRAPAELLLPLEERVLGRCIINGPMIRRCFGSGVLRELANKSVVCSGVLLGTPAAFDALRAIASLAHRCPIDKMSDQAALNYLVYYSRGTLLRPRDGSGSPVHVALQPRGSGYTNTVGVFKGTKNTHAFEREHMRGGEVLNDDGTPSPVVHQYDRILKSTGRGSQYGSSEALLRLRAVDKALGGPRADASWMVAGA
jgi:hypothetical protein